MKKIKNILYLFEKHKKINIFLFIVLFIIFFFRPATLVYKENIFLRNYHSLYELLEQSYYNSQYVKKDNPGIMPDEKVYAFGGGIFLKGLNPILIVHDHPPLGRYIISLSILIFDNANTIPIFLLFSSAVGIFLVGQEIFKNKFLSLIPVGMFVNEPIFLSKVNFSPLLETIQFPFIIFGIYFFIKGISEKKFGKWFFLIGIILGFVISTRFFMPGLFMLFTFLSFFAINKNLISKRFTMFLLFLPISIFILIASYAKTIASGYSVLQIFGIQKYVFFYQSSKLILPFSFWDLFLFNKWHTWWGDMRLLSDPDWLITWPITLSLSLLSFILLIVKRERIQNSEKIVFLWTFFYIAMLNGGTSTTRYFLPLTPFLYILTISFIKRVAIQVTKDRNT